MSNGPTWLPSTFRALRHPNYRLYFFGQIVSLTGSWVQTTVMMWLAWELTQRAYWPPLISAAHVIPTLLLGIAGGALADRWPKRMLIFVAQASLLLLSLALAGFGYVDALGPMALLVISLLIGVVNAIDTPARLAFVIDMTGRDDLLNAVALNSLIFNTARLVGPALAGELLEVIGASGCFLVNAATFAAVLVALVAMRLPPPVETQTPRDTGTTMGALRLLARRPAYLMLLFLGGSLAFFGWPLLALLPAVSDRVLQTSSAGFSKMTAAVGAGALVGALIVATFSTPRYRLWLLALGIVTGVASLIGVGMSSQLIAALAWCALSGFGLILFFATAQAMLQLGADEHNRGRVMGVWLAVLAGAQPAGNLVSGYLADGWGVRTALLIDAVGIVAMTVVSVLLFLALRSASRPPSGEVPQ